MSVEQDLIQIMQARYGRDVRQSIHDAIYNINEVAKDAQYHASTSTASAQAYADAALASERAAADAQAAAEAAAQEAMSGTPAGYADLVALVGDTQVNHATGDSLALVDTVEGDALLQCAYGMSIQNGTPTPSSPVEIKSAKADFKVVGKNLLNLSEFDSNRTNANTTCVVDSNRLIINGTANGSAAQPFGSANLKKLVKCKVGDKFKFVTRVVSGSLTRTDETTKLGVYSWDGAKKTFQNVFSTKNLVAGNIAIQEKTITANDIDENGWVKINGFQVWVISGDVYDNLVLESILVYDGVDTTYEPYVAKDISTDITLRAIEVASTDAYNLVKDGKYYISDKLNWNESKGFNIERHIGLLQFSSVTSFNTADNSAVCNLDSNANVLLSQRANVLCNLLPKGTSNTNCCRINSNGTSFLMYQSDFTSASAWNAFLSETNAIVHYILATPYEETITPEQALSLLSLKTYDEATYITGTSDVAPVIELHYAKSETTAKALTGHNEGYKAQEFENLYGVKNLIPYPYKHTTKTVNGITFTDNGDGTITVNGTATGDANFDMVEPWSYSSQLELQPNCIYEFTAGVKSSINDSCQAVLCTSANARQWLADTSGDGRIIQTDDSYKYIGFRISLPNGTVANNITFKPMLRLATIQDDSYTEYAMSNLELTKAVQDLITRVTTLEG